MKSVQNLLFQKISQLKNEIEIMETEIQQVEYDLEDSKACLQNKRQLLQECLLVAEMLIKGFNGQI